MKRKMLVVAILAIFLTLCLSGYSLAQNAPDKTARKSRRNTERKELQGEVTWITKNKIAFVIARGDRSETEMLLPIAKDAQLVHVSSLDQIHAGDTVSIEYEEVTEGEKADRVAKKIYFIRPGNKVRPPFFDNPNKGQSDNGLLKSE